MCVHETSLGLACPPPPLHLGIVDTMKPFGGPTAVDRGQSNGTRALERENGRRRLIGQDSKGRADVKRGKKFK